MGKIISKYVCQSCGYESSKWLGKCPGCSSWNSLLEERLEKKPSLHSKKEAVPLASVSDQEVTRFSSGLSEFDRVLGGGIVPGSIILLGGDPGIGKSTLLLQVAYRVAGKGGKVIYLSGEESIKQTKLRALRLGVESDSIFLLNEQNIDGLEEYIKELDPLIVIIDSIQTVYSRDIASIPGSIAQLRECTARIVEIGKRMNKSFILVGHVTKDGSIAGPKVLEHMVDVVISFEGDRNFALRLLRAGKNRFGSTDEIGLMEMSSRGLVEVIDPSYIFLSSSAIASGVAITASFEGSRPLLIEIQALVSPSGPGYPRRMASGIDQNRLALIIAVLEKRTRYNLSAYDVYVKVTGGVFLKDPSVDLGIAAAIISSYLDKALSFDTVFVGEIGLSGQIRPVPMLDSRVKEIERLGYKRAIIPEQKSAGFASGLEVIEIGNIGDFIDIIMEG